MGKSTLELLRDARDEAHEVLENVKDRDLHRWENESKEHFEHRQKLQRKKRAEKRKIYEALDRRAENAAKRKQERREETRAEKFDPHGGGIVAFDGLPDGLVEWIAHDLQDAREHGWGGMAFSGFRSPEKSEGICISICGAPSCPGRCAGRSSKHSEKGDGGGAADCSDYTNLERILHERGSRLFNDLPADLPHFSSSGH